MKGTRFCTRTTPFVRNLSKILSESKYSAMIAWEPSGNRFVIKDPVKFASEVLPQYYETNKLVSFTRQLYIYDFCRVSDRRTKQGSDSLMVIYSHRYFRRDQPNDYYLVQRVKSPYFRGIVAFSTSEVEASTIAKPTATLLSPATSSYPPISAQSTSPDENELVCTEVPVDHCLNCSILRQEVKLMSKLIEYYTFLVNELVILDSPVYESLLSLQTPIASNFQEIRFPEKSLLFPTGIPPVVDISLSLASNCYPILYPNDYSYSSSAINRPLFSKTGTF